MKKATKLIIAIGGGALLGFVAKRLSCAVVGHEDIKVSDGSRLWVRCLRCGRESVGVNLNNNKEK